MVAESNKKIKEQLGVAVEHLQLHGAAPLKCASATNDEGEVMGAQLGVRVGSVGVGVASRSEDGAALNA